MDINQLQDRFITGQNKRNAYRHAMNILNYDAETVLPSDGNEQYGNVMGVLAGESYKLLVNDELKALLTEMKEHREQLPLWMCREAEELERMIKKTEAIPAEEYSAFQTAAAISGQAWREAKQNNDYAHFAPHMQKMIDYSRRFAQLYDDKRPTYDVMLDDYESGLTVEQLDPLFADIRAELTPIILKISNAEQPDCSFLQGDFPVDKQKQLSDYIMQLMTIDRNRCAIGETEHPFTTSTCNRDVRITTHYHSDDLLSSLYSVVHEGGHALYMLHTADELNGSSLAEGASLSIHESVSRFFENYIGRSRPFTALILAKLKELFPQQFAAVTEDQFYRACNVSRPSLIRTEADELTYPLHIMVRYELEKQLIAGTLSIDDLPAKWNRLYKEYLGVNVPNDTQGVLQDTHWSDASFGYFPTYALGSAYGAQILATMEKELPEMWELIARGELAPIVEWMKEKLFIHGGIKRPTELLHDICGENFDPRYYVEHLRKKYSELYHL